MSLQCYNPLSKLISEMICHLPPKAFKWEREYGDELVQKVRFKRLEDGIIDLWHYLYALRLRLKDISNPM